MCVILCSCRVCRSLALNVFTVDVRIINKLLRKDEISTAVSVAEKQGFQVEPDVSVTRLAYKEVNLVNAHMLSWHGETDRD